MLPASDNPDLAARLNAILNDLTPRKDTIAAHRRAHRRAHRPGRPGKIEGDPELAAFIRARIDTLTYAQIMSEVRGAFPPDRHCSHSGIGRWWQKRNPG